MHRVGYGQDTIFDFPLIDAGASAFESTPVTIAAGDIKVAHSRLIPTNPSGKTVAFTSGGTYEVKPGDTITGATSSATAVVMGIRLTSGTWGGGDAAGILFVRSDSGTFQSENLNVGANTNVATIGGALDAAGLFKHISGGMYAVGIPGTQLEGSKGWIKIQDQTATEEWEDVAILFQTTGHEYADDPQGCILTDAVGSATGQTTTNIRLSGAPLIAPKVGYYFEFVSGTGIRQAGYIKTYTTGATYDITPYVALDTAADATSVIKVFIDAKRAPVHVVNSEPHGSAYESKTDQELLEKITAVVMGPTSGAGTGTEVFKNPTGAGSEVSVTNDGTNRTATDLTP